MALYWWGSRTGRRAGAPRERVDHIELLLPREADAITAQVSAFLAQRHVVGSFGMVVLLFFSTQAFSVLEAAMSSSSITRAARAPAPRRVAADAARFILLVGISVFLVTFISGAVHALDERGITVLATRGSSARHRDVPLPARRDRSDPADDGAVSRSAGRRIAVRHASSAASSPACCGRSSGTCSSGTSRRCRWSTSSTARWRRPSWRCWPRDRRDHLPLRCQVIAEFERCSAEAPGGFET